MTPSNARRAQLLFAVLIALVVAAIVYRWTARISDPGPSGDSVGSDAARISVLTQ